MFYEGVLGRKLDRTLYVGFGTPLGQHRFKHIFCTQ